MEARRAACEVKTHGFPSQAEKAISYGIHDMATNTGWVSIGTDHDTAAFAVASIRRRWRSHRESAVGLGDRVSVAYGSGG